MWFCLVLPCSDVITSAFRRPRAITGGSRLLRRLRLRRLSMFAARQRLHASLDGLVRAHCAPMGAICATRVAHGLRMAPMGILRPMIAAMGEMSFWVDVSVFQDRPVNGWRTAEAVTISNAADRGSEIKPRLDLAVDDDAGGHEPEPLVERSWSARASTHDSSRASRPSARSWSASSLMARPPTPRRWWRRSIRNRHRYGSVSPGDTAESIMKPTISPSACTARAHGTTRCSPCIGGTRACANERAIGATNRSW